MSVLEVFQADRKTMRLWGRALLFCDPEFLQRVLLGREVCRKRTAAVEAYAYVGYERKEGTVVYYCGTMPVFSHAVDDLDSFRMVVSQIYVNGSVRQASLTRAFQIQPLALKRWVKRYRAQGARAFFQSPKRGSKPRVLTAEMREKAQARLDQGQAISEISAEFLLRNGNTVTWKLAERGVLLGAEKDD